MEDALAQPAHKLVVFDQEGLNPCCNGRCTRTGIRPMSLIISTVLILVVMEDALARRTT